MVINIVTIISVITANIQSIKLNGAGTNIEIQLLNSQDYFRSIPEMYSKLVSNYAENTIAMSRIFNDMAFSNIELFKHVVDNTKKQSKHLAEIGKRNVSTYERIEKDNNDALLSTQKDYQSTRK